MGEVRGRSRLLKMNMSLDHAIMVENMTTSCKKYKSPSMSIAAGFLSSLELSVTTLMGKGMRVDSNV